MNDTLNRILACWTDDEAFQGEVGNLDLPFNIELFCVGNDALIESLQAQVARQEKLRKLRITFIKKLQDTIAEQAARIAELEEFQKYPRLKDAETIDRLRARIAELTRHIDQNSLRHPWYGPCDSIADGACSECNKFPARIATLTEEIYECENNPDFHGHDSAYEPEPRTAPDLEAMDYDPKN